MAESEPRNEYPYLIENVYVKVEVVEDGVIEGIDDDNSQPLQKTTAPKKRKKPNVTLTCDQCDYKTIYKACLKFHKMKHTNTSISCELCSYSTKYPTSLQRHTLSFHNDSSNLPKYKCPECPYESIFKSNLAGHMRKHSTDKKFQCKDCNFATAYRLLLIKHNRIHHSEDRKSTFHCDKCPYIAKTDGYLVRHLAQVHRDVSDNMVKCENCNFITKTRWRLTIHRKKSFQNSTLNCSPCEFATHYKCEFRMHKKRHEVEKSIMKTADITQDGLIPNKPIQEVIPGSNKIITNSYQLNSQQLEQSHFCNQYVEIDPNTAENYINWRDIPVHEISGQEKPFQCTICGHMSKFKAAVQRHYQRRHMANTKPYKCVNCDFSTKTKDQITLHNKRSKSDSPQCCPNCSFVTYFKCLLMMHQKVHFPFRCDLCDYCCRQKYYMQKHYATVHQRNYQDVTPHFAPQEGDSTASQNAPSTVAVTSGGEQDVLNS